MSKPKDEKLVHIIPVPGVSIFGFPAAEQDVTEDDWAWIKEYKPPAFIREPLPQEDKPPKEGDR